TRDKFVAKRRMLAEREWRRLKANDSLECRNCHNFEYMDFTLQSPRARQMHSTLLASGEKTCIDCHKGIAHHLPDMSGVPVGYNTLMQEGPILDENLLNDVIAGEVPWHTHAWDEALLEPWQVDTVHQVVMATGALPPHTTARFSTEIPRRSD